MLLTVLIQMCQGVVKVGGLVNPLVIGLHE